MGRLCHIHCGGINALVGRGHGFPKAKRVLVLEREKRLAVACAPRKSLLRGSPDVHWRQTFVSSLTSPAHAALDLILATAWAGILPYRPHFHSRAAARRVFAGLDHRTGRQHQDIHAGASGDGDRPPPTSENRIRCAVSCSPLLGGELWAGQRRSF